MLPNFSKIQNLLSDRIYRTIKEKIRQKSGAFDAPTVSLFEGDSLSVLREDGTYDESKLSKMEATSIIQKEQLANPNVAIGETIEALSEQLANQQVKVIIGELEKTPNQVDSGGKFTIETVFEALEKIRIDFIDGQASMPQLVVSPQLFASARDIFIASENDPEIKKRFDELMERKRREWLDRESSRKLVD